MAEHCPIIQVKLLTPEQEEMKNFLLGRGYKLSVLMRNYLIKLYNDELAKA